MPGPKNRAIDEMCASAQEQGIRALVKDDCTPGEALWLIDFFTPFGGADNMIKELREKVFEGQKIKTLQPAPDGSGPAVVEW